MERSDEAGTHDQGARAADVVALAQSLWASAVDSLTQAMSGASPDDFELVLSEFVEQSHDDALEWSGVYQLLWAAGGGLSLDQHESDQNVSSDHAATIWEIQLILESNDAEEVERIAESVAQLVCPDCDEPGEDHRCRIPWMLVTSEHDGDTGAEEWREHLNR